MLSKEEFADAVRKLRDPNHRMEREGEYWNKDEIEHLKEMFDSHVGITMMAVLLQRSESAVSVSFSTAILNLYEFRTADFLCPYAGSGPAEGKTQKFCRKGLIFQKKKIEL